MMPQITRNRLLYVNSVVQPSNAVISFISLECRNFSHNFIQIQNVYAFAFYRSPNSSHFRVNIVETFIYRSSFIRSFAL